MKLIEEWAKENGIGCAIEEVIGEVEDRFRLPALQMKCVEIQNNSVEGDGLILHQGAQDHNGAFVFDEICQGLDDHLLFCIDFNYFSCFFDEYHDFPSPWPLAPAAGRAGDSGGS